MKFNIYKLATSEKEFKEKIIDFHKILGMEVSEECTSKDSPENKHFDYQGLIIGVDKYSIVNISENKTLVWSAYVNKTSEGAPAWSDDFLSLSGMSKEAVSFENKNNTSGIIYIRFINREKLPNCLDINNSINPVFVNNYNLEKYFIHYTESDFLVTWGEGWRIAENIKIKDFGLKVVANLVHYDEILHLSAKEISLNGRAVTSRIYHPGKFPQFKIDSESELTNKMSGEFEIRDGLFSGSKLKKIKLSGASSITFGSSKYNPGIKDLLSDIIRLNNYYYKDNYKSEHKYLDNLESVPAESNLYEYILLEIIKGLDNGTQEYILDLENEDSMEEENYVLNINSKIQSIDKFYNINHPYTDIYGNEIDIKLSSALRAEVNLDDKTYIYFGGDIYRVPDGVVESLNRSLQKVKYIDNLLPHDWNSSQNVTELDYNQSIPAADSKYISLDQVFYKISKERTAYEICDLFSSEGYIIHVKKDAGQNKGAASISHLCAQAYNSAFSMQEDDDILSDYENIFKSSNLSNVKLKNSISAGAKKRRGNLQNHLSSFSKKDFKILLCIALDSKNFIDSENNVKSMSYLRKVTINSLKNSLRDIGLDLYITTVKYI